MEVRKAVMDSLNKDAFEGLFDQTSGDVKRHGDVHWALIL